MLNYTSMQDTAFESAITSIWGVEFVDITASELTLRVAIGGDGPLVILVHGFPESWYSWRHQIKPLTDAGYRVAIPDVRGYGGSDKPQSIAAYSIEALSRDMADIASALSPAEPAVIIGHDWGAPIAWNSAILFKKQFRAVGGLSVPYLPPGDTNAIDLFRKIYTDKGLFYYMVYFQQPDIAEAELEADPARSIRLFYTALAADAKPNAWQENKPVSTTLFDGVPDPDMPRSWLTEEDVFYYARQFTRSGFRGPLNRYRNFETDNQFLLKTGKRSITQPSLFIHGDKDMVNRMYPAGPVKAMQPFVSAQHQSKTLQDCGHWTQQEQPEAVSQLILDWLETV